MPTIARRIRNTLLNAACFESLGYYHPFAAWVRDMRTGRYTWQSHEYGALFGFPERYLIGKTPFEAFDPVTARAYDETDRVVQRTGTVLQRAVVAQFEDGHRPILTRKFPVFSLFRRRVIAVQGMCFEAPGAA